MDTVAFRLHELPTVIGALSALVPEPSPKQQGVLHTILRVHGVCMDLEELPRPELPEVAAVVADDCRRKWLVRVGIVLSMVDGRIAPESATAIADLAHALDVREPAVGTLRRLARRGFSWPASSAAHTRPAVLH